MALTVILGKTCSGKDTIAKELIQRGFEKVVTYTTRPMRGGEIDGKTYHFISDSEFEEMKDDFFEWREYDTVYGKWFYGSMIPKDVKDKRYIIILNPDGLKSLKSNNIQHKSIYIRAKDSTLRTRLINRGDDPSEAERRLKSDNYDFQSIFTDHAIENEDGCSIKDICDKIEFLCKE